MCKKVEYVANALIDHLKRSPTLNKTVELVDGVIDEINKNFQHKPISLDDLINRLSNSADEEILLIQYQESLNFIGGELIISEKSSQLGFFSMDLKLYFQNHLDKIILKEKHKELNLFILTNESQQELKQKGIIKYEVNKPKK
ncbi:hypothetical protein C9426_14225 [Serratia sp. S1B]|nr:hypothetical protein C9426_14225 [Serratia sp. S1B]